MATKGVTPASRAARVGLGSKPRVDREERRELYLRIAAEVFLRKGLNTATMQDVADALGAPKVLIYRIFPNKQALMDALLERVLSAIHDAYAQPYRAYGERVLQIVRTAREHPDLFLLVLRYSRGGAEQNRWRAEIWETFAAYVEARWFLPGEGVAPGAGGRARLAALQVVGPIVDVLINWLEGADGLTDAARAEWWGRVSREYHRALRDAFRLGAPPTRYGFENDEIET
ncbi:TetR/AcrR family transcriptional regulator [Phenylobacterium sp. J426]|uniref:TetR/AcrR family transcriptional regulator n=1 Tax=Phenylobacterium sp. J426 TaxID=2898439 RepID=UPI002150CB88|nr:TetR/AcrR family transcriptional regulator [Phenylobacterium sp. J426]MCR5876750.1 TetR/AcrR family transcriptional regulator [Phenylobacterium sp. J426]